MMQQEARRRLACGTGDPDRKQLAVRSVQLCRRDLGLRDFGVADDALWQRAWQQLFGQDSYCATSHRIGYQSNRIVFTDSVNNQFAFTTFQ